MDPLLLILMQPTPAIERPADPLPRNGPVVIQGAPGEKPPRQCWQFDMGELGVAIQCPPE